MTDEELYYKVFPNGCWHEIGEWRGDFGGYNNYLPVYGCVKCKKGSTSTDTSWLQNPNFSTWEGFGVLWEGMQEHRLWPKFVDYYGVWEPEDSSVGLGKVEDIDAYIINPTRFRDACKEFFNDAK